MKHGIISEAVEFNVGGQRYEVSCSLLDKHPKSLLATCLSQQEWQVNPEDEIFIEGNGLRFQYVLDYMRKHTLDLPVTESKQTMIAELEYYGIEVDANSINDAAVNTLKSIQSMKQMMNTLGEKVTTLHEDYHAAKLATDCIRLWYKNDVFVPNRPTEYAFNWRDLDRSKLTSEDRLIIDNAEAFFQLQPDGHKREASVNVYLNQVGLQVYWLSRRDKCLKLKEIDA